MPTSSSTTNLVVKPIKPFTSSELDMRVKNGQSTVVVVGANWCPYCVKNYPAWESDPVQQYLLDNEIAMLYIDMSGNSPEGQSYLLKNKQKTIPFGILYYKGKEIKLPQNFDSAKLLDFLKRNISDKQSQVRKLGLLETNKTVILILGELPPYWNSIQVQKYIKQSSVKAIQILPNSSQEKLILNILEN